MVRELGVHGDERQKLAERLASLVQSGQLLKIAADRFALPENKSGKNVFAGRLSLHRDGYGFVLPWFDCYWRAPV